MELLYEGKAKKIFKTDNPDEVVCYFKDSLTAFNGKKSSEATGKGILNATITALIFKGAEEAGIPTHFIKQLSERELLVKRVEIIPIEVVVRNIVAGSLCRRLGLKEGERLAFPIVEFYYKNDALNDPLINDDHALILKLISARQELEQLRQYGLEVNRFLTQFFDQIGLTLVDFKVEFGRDSSGQILLADEITPDSCRLWDKATGRRLDKDLFRFDLGNITSAYSEIVSRLKNRQ